MLLLGQSMTVTSKDGQQIQGEIYYFNDEAVVLKQITEEGCKFMLLNL
jgi:hypothetical protein